MSGDPLAALKASRAQAFNLSTNIGRTRLRALLEKADRELSQRLHQSDWLRGSGKDTFTATQMRVTLAQIRAVTANVTHGMAKLMGQQAEDASSHAVSSLVDYLQRAEKAFSGVASQPLPLREAAMLSKVGQGVNSSLLRRLASSGEPLAGADEEPHPAKLGILQRYGVDTIDHFEDSLQQSVVQRKTWAETRGDMVEQSPFLQGAPAHWAERVVRTETMGAYNRAGWETIREADQALGDMCKILAATFDDRTGWDSYQVHGQIRRPEEPFAWADGLYQHPPNRPNDRETVVPHRIAWVIPPYLKPKSDGEVAARYKMERKTGSPGPRPMMTTIPLNSFGKSPK